MPTGQPEYGQVYEDPHERARLRRMAIDACTLCDEDGYLVGATVCDHVDHTETNRRGMALVREALKGKPNDPSVLHRVSAMPLADRRRAEAPPALLSDNRTVGDPEPEL